ncbi:MAG: glycosyltransferase family 2 protein [Chloroflexi bacterium]|nr:glycosyltransferase family 2 protein [Chloroflexota bacterium]
MKIIAVMPVRNEDWILERNLQTLSHFCDVIIVADQNSTDNTRQICKRYPKVLLIRNPCEQFDQSKARQLLLDTVREFDGYNIILAVDADEIVSGNVLDNPAWDNALDSLEPGVSSLLQWIILWKHPFRIRDDTSVWSNSWKHFICRDDRKTNFSEQAIHEPRIPRPFTDRARRFEEVKVLHYQFVTWQRMLSKQRYYRVLERMMSPTKSPDAINQTYVITRDERGMVLKQVPEEWVKPWQDLGVDLEHFAEEELFWYDIEILRFFGQHSTQDFADLDIWDVDWECKRQLALAQGYDNLPEQPIRDPRNLEQRLYHAYLHRYISTPRWRQSDPLDPARTVARRLGLKRAHLERLGLLKPRQGGKDS